MMALRRMAYLSVAAALVTMGLKFLAFWLTGSVSLFSDAAR
jgi:divalent metal cation (Fe/Co/Zn/Cd) transporter